MTFNISESEKNNIFKRTTQVYTHVFICTIFTMSQKPLLFTTDIKTNLELYRIFVFLLYFVKYRQLNCRLLSYSEIFCDSSDSTQFQVHIKKVINWFQSCNHSQSIIDLLSSESNTNLILKFKRFNQQHFINVPEVNGIHY